MIPEIFVEEWRERLKWQNLAQVEQDLVISRALVDLYNNSHVRNTLVFRGGTALNKLFLKPPSRYSEDLDFVQLESGPIGPTIDAIREALNHWLGDPQWKITQRSAKLIYKYESINGLPAKLKVEINTTEHFQVLPLLSEKFIVDSAWAPGKASIITYQLEELMATKLRALYQRRKGRDLFDMWYVMSNKLINFEAMIEVFRKYCEKDDTSISQKEFLKNMELKQDQKDFQYDINALLPQNKNWDFDKAYEYVIENVIRRLP